MDMPARGRGRRPQPLTLTDDERAELQRLARRHTTAQNLAMRARIVLRCAEGASNRAVAEALGVHEDTVSIWRGRFHRDRLDGLSDEPRSGAPRKVTDAQVESYFRTQIQPQLPEGSEAKVEDYRERIQEALIQQRANEDADAWVKETRRRIVIDFHPEVFP